MQLHAARITRLGWDGMYPTGFGCNTAAAGKARQQKASPFRRPQDSISAAEPQSNNSQRLSQAVIQLQAVPYLHVLLAMVQQSDVPPGSTCSVSSADR
jgi:hypothetical protein